MSSKKPSHPPAEQIRPVVYPGIKTTVAKPGPVKTTEAKLSASIVRR